MFVKAIRTGMHMGADGRPILPPMPWPEFRTLTDDDLKAIFAFLKTIPAIHNPVADPKVPPPVLQGMAKSRPKLVEILDAAHKGPPPAGSPGGRTREGRGREGRARERRARERRGRGSPSR
jgi:hypothetical protein